MGIYNVDVFYDVNGSKQVFYVRPFSEEIKCDLERLMTDVDKVCEKISITKKEGTYIISTVASGKDDIQPFMEGMWGILFRKFMSESHHVCVDPITEEKYYAVIFSSEFINPCERRKVA